MIHEKINLKEYFPMLEKDVELLSYCPDNFEEFSIGKKRKTILLLPGGAYEMVSSREGEPVALRLAGENINVFLLNYNTPPAHYPYPLIEALAAVAYIRQNIEKYHGFEDKIGVLGFSAGGHLAASVACYCEREEYASFLQVDVKDIKVNGCLLSYPVISTKDFSHQVSVKNVTEGFKEDLMRHFCIEEQVTERFPKTFIWHTAPDTCVPVKNSLVLAEALAKHHVFFEMHIYPVADHGISLANEACYSIQTSEAFLQSIHYPSQWIYAAIHFIQCYLGEEQ